MTPAKLSVEHPGTYIRREILAPLTLTVTQAARLLDVSRPALSNLLSGHAALSAEMALRLEIAFDISMNELLQRQLAYDVAWTRTHARGQLRVQRFVKDGGRNRVAAVNAALKARGEEPRLRRGAGYYYFDGPALAWPSSSVTVYRADSLTVEQWLDEYQQLKEAAGLAQKG